MNFNRDVQWKKERRKKIKEWFCLWKVHVNWVTSFLFDKFLKKYFCEKMNEVCPFFNVLIYEFIDWFEWLWWIWRRIFRSLLSLFFFIFYHFSRLLKKIYFIYEKMVGKRKYCFFGNCVHTICAPFESKIVPNILIIIRIVTEAKFMDST